MNKQLYLEFSGPNINIHTYFKSNLRNISFEGRMTPSQKFLQSIKNEIFYTFEEDADEYTFYSKLYDYITNSSIITKENIYIVKGIK